MTITKGKKSNGGKQTVKKSSLSDKNESGKELSELPKDVPSYLVKPGQVQRGFENVKKDDLQLPRLKLLQALSPEVEDEKGKAGDIINSLSDENYGTELSFIPILQSYSRVYWASKEKDAEILCSSNDGIVPSPAIEEPPAKTCEACPNSKFIEDEGPVCTEFYNFPVLVNGKEPAGLALSRTKISVAKRLISKAMYAGKGLDLFSMKFKLRSKKVTGEKFSYYNFDVVGAGFVTEVEFKAAESFYNSIRNKFVTIHQSNEAEKE